LLCKFTFLQSTLFYQLLFTKPNQSIKMKTSIVCVALLSATVALAAPRHQQGGHFRGHHGHGHGHGGQGNQPQPPSPPTGTPSGAGSVPSEPDAIPANLLSFDAQNGIPPNDPSQSSQQAAADWQTDTGLVSHFLDTATTYTGDEYTKQAQIALDAEKNELLHKAVLDALPQVTSQPSITAANDSLVTQAHFQDVVDRLAFMLAQGPSVAAAQVQAINANRCVNVLPSIDAYLKAGGTDLLSIRPKVCNLNGVKTN
jgi:hypothetical protein